MFYYKHKYIYKTSSLNASNNGNASSILAIKRVNIILTDHFRRKNMTDKVLFCFRSGLFILPIIRKSQFKSTFKPTVPSGFTSEVEFLFVQ